MRSEETRIRLAEARRTSSEILAFVELHIEQGGILDSEKINIGVVEGIVGINWWDITILGFRQSRRDDSDGSAKRRSTGRCENS